MLSFPLKLKPERPTGTAMGGESVVGSVSLNGDWQGAVDAGVLTKARLSLRWTDLWNGGRRGRI